MNSSSKNTEQSCSTFRPMERIIRRIADAFVTVSLALGYFVHPGWFGFTAFVGVNLFQSSFTGFCPLEKVLHKFGVASNTPSSTVS